MKIITKEVVDNFGMNSDNLEFVSSYNCYEDNNGSINMAKVPRMVPTSKHISVKYHCFMKHVGKEFFDSKY